MAKRKKRRQVERVLEPLSRPGEPIKVPSKAPVKVPTRSHKQVSSTACWEWRIPSGRCSTRIGVPRSCLAWLWRCGGSVKSRSRWSVGSEHT